MRKGPWVIIVILLMCAALLMGCGETVEPQKIDKAATDQAPKQEPANTQTFAVGDTVKMGDLEITLNAARWDKGNQFSKPEAGQRWLALDCTIENQANQPVGVSSLMMFKLYDAEAFSCPLEIFAETKGGLDGEVGPGRKMRGEIAFTVEEGHSAWEFIFAPNVFGFGQAIFEITEDDVQ